MMLDTKSQIVTIKYLMQQLGKFMFTIVNLNTDCEHLCRKVKELVDLMSKSGQLDPADSMIYIEIKGVSHTINPTNPEPKRLEN